MITSALNAPECFREQHDIEIGSDLLLRCFGMTLYKRKAQLDVQDVLNYKCVGLLEFVIK